MPNREFNRLLSQHSDGAKKRTEKTTQSSNQSTPDFVRRSYRLTSENPGLQREMQPSDWVRTSDGSRSRSGRLLLKMKAELRKLRKGLKKANQENGKLQNTVQELTHHSQQAHREKADLAHQLEQARREKADLAHQLEQARREKEDLNHQLKQPRGKEETRFKSIWMKALPEDIKRKWAMDEVKFKKTIDDLTKKHDALLQAMAQMRYEQSYPKISWWAFAFPDSYPYGWGYAYPYGWEGWY